MPLKIESVSPFDFKKLARKASSLDDGTQGARSQLVVIGPRRRDG